MATEMTPQERAAAWWSLIRDIQKIRDSVENGIWAEHRSGYQRACNEIIGLILSYKNFTDYRRITGTEQAAGVREILLICEQEASNAGNSGDYQAAARYIAECCRDRLAQEG